MSDFWGPTMFYGRAFDLADGTIILPCGFCATPEFPGAVHACQAKADHEFASLAEAFGGSLT